MPVCMSTFKNSRTGFSFVFGFSLNLILGSYAEICCHITVKIKIEEQKWTLYMKSDKCFCVWK
jgi:hypothetical protein